MTTPRGCYVVRMARMLVLVLLIGTACGAAPRNKPSWPDAPIELRDDTDRDAAIDLLWVTPSGAARDRLRTEIADATAKRLADALTSGSSHASWRVARLGAVLALVGSIVLARLPTDAAALAVKADALGTLIRAGVDPDDAARRVGLPGVKFTGAVPVSLRLPENDAATLEGKS